MTTVGEAFITIRPDSAAFRADLDRGVTGSVNRLTRRLAVLTGGALSLRAAFGGTIGAAISFESAFAGVEKTVDATDAELAKLRSGIRDMAKQLPAGTTEIAKVAEAAGQLGIATPNILGFTKVMIDLGETTNLTSDEAATSLAKLANVTKLPQTEFDRLGAAVVALGNNGASTEKDIVELGQRLAAAGTIAGLSSADILGFASALSSVGIEAEAGGTAFSKVFVELANASAKGGEDLEKFAKVAGVSAKEFQRRFKDDAAGATIDFVEGLGRIQKEGGNVFQVLDDLGIVEIRMRNALLSSANAGDLMRESIKTSNDAFRENNALTEEAQKRYKTTAAQMKILRNRIADAGISIGEKLLPAINGLLSSLSKVSNFITTTFGPALQKVADFVVRYIVPAVRDFVEGVGGRLLDVFRNIVGTIKENQTGLENLGKAIAVVVAVLSATLIPVLKVALQLFTTIAGVAIEAVIRALGYLGGALETAGGVIAFFRETLVSIWHAARTVYEKVVEWLGKAVTWLKELPGKIASAVGDWLGPVKGPVDFLIGRLEYLNRLTNSIDFGKLQQAAAAGVITGGVGKPPGRALGGPVIAGRPYIVGEGGPELFIPRPSGSIVPLKGYAGAAMAGAASMQINQTFYDSRISARDAFYEAEWARKTATR